ncbi:MAG: NPCBM/NEW2 domain-containing protein [Planctomycetota bacterium]
MTTVRLRRTTLTLIATLGVAVVGAAPREAVLLSGERLRERLTAFIYDAGDASNAAAVFGGERETAPGSLVCWGALAAPKPGVWVRFTDGSRLSAGPDWTDDPVVRLDADAGAVRRAEAWIAAPRSAIGRILFSGVPEPTAPTAGATDTLVLRDDSGADGDRYQGAIVGIADGVVTGRLLGEETTIDVSRVSVVSLANAIADGPTGGCLVGLGDGSVLVAERVRVTPRDVSIVTTDSVRLVSKRDELVFLQPLGGRVRYLSDAAPRDYRHTPYFDLRWPLGRDATPLGDPLVVRGRRYAKAVACHAAARIVYAVADDESRFQAELAVADPLRGGQPGSVVFRVFAVRDSRVDELYTSETIRSGEEPVPIDLDVRGAAGLVLIVDFADRGDAGDDALWLDARMARVRD